MNEEIKTTAPEEQFGIVENSENPGNELNNESTEQEMPVQQELELLGVTDDKTEVVESQTEEIVESQPEETVENNSDEETENQPAEVVESQPEEIVESQPAETVENDSNEETESQPAEVVESKTEEIVENKPEVVESVSEVVEIESEKVVEDNSEESVSSKVNDNVDYTKLSLKEIVQSFSDLIEKGDQQEMYREAEKIKAAFYVVLKKEKIAIGYVAPVTDAVVSEEQSEEVVSNNPFAEIERAFKELYGKYKDSRNQFLHNMERNKEENLVKKLAIIEELKQLVEKQEDVNQTFPAFRELQNKWRESGPVPQNRIKDLYETYQHYVEMFYDYVKINNEFRDLDFKKNYEAKVELCEKAEALKDEPNMIAAFAQLQKLHEEWKELGPVRKESREEIWNRFKEATSVINKKHQRHFEGLKEDQKENLQKKTELCEKAEEIAAREINDSNGWNVGSKEIEELQKSWKSIGFASKKDNQKIYDRFRAACDAFYSKKRDYYSSFKDQMQENYNKKVALCEQAEALKDSVEWKKATDQLISLQKQWKEIGPVSRKKSDQVWKRFRAACDFFFENRDKNSGGNDAGFEENLQKKEALIEQIKSYVITSDSDKDMEALNEFQNQWRGIGFVPGKDKERIQKEYRDAMMTTFEQYKDRISDARGQGKPRRPQKDNNRYRSNDRGPKSELDRLILKYRKKESDIATWENNMGFFAKSKNADALLEELHKKIEVAKEELKQLEETIKAQENQ